MNLVIVAVLLTGFMYWEILLLIAMAFGDRRHSLQKALYYEDKAIALIFSMFKEYGGFRIRLVDKVGSRLPKRFLMVSNHQSLLDIPILMKLVSPRSRGRFVAKRELAWGIPLISLLLRTVGHSLINRKGDMVHAMRAIERMAARCAKEGTVPVIFPEGTRSKTGDLGTFHSAGYRKLLEADRLPILVVAVDGGWRVAKLRDFFRNFGKAPYSVTYIDVLPAPQNKREALALLEKARASIDAELAEGRKGGRSGR